jgi:hypothetical protein
MKAQRWLFVLPAIYVIVIGLTALCDSSQLGGVFYRIIGIDPVGMIAMWSSSGIVALTAVFLVTGTPWWYFIARIGWSSKKLRISRFSSLLGSLLSFFTLFVCWSMTISALMQDVHENLLTRTAIAQYSLVALLCVGALISAVFSAVALFSRRIGPPEAIHNQA